MNVLILIGLLLAGLWVALVWRAGRGVTTNTTARSEPSRAGINRQQFDDSMALLDQALESGEITPEQAQSDRAELQQQLIASSEASAQDRPWQHAIGAPARLAFMVLPLSVAALAFMATNGSMHWPMAQPRAAEAGVPDIEEMVARLAQRLEANPDDPTGWAMLGRSYMVMQRFSAAAEAYAEANARTPEPDADWLASQAEALGLARGQDLQGRPEELLQRALALDSENMRALWLLALAAEARAERDIAFGYLQRLSRLPDLPPELQNALVEIGVIESQNDSASAPEGNYALNVRVRLSETLAQQAPPGTTVFVFARSAGGPPMPVAVTRVGAGRWPLEVTLTDANSMTPDRNLSTQTDLELVARISSTGGAQAQSGDWEGVTRWTNSSQGGSVELTIDRVIP